MQPKVSVIIPVYNGEDYLVETLECALTQDLRDIEVICVDDGSTDRSAEIVRAIAEVDSRLRLVQQPNQGAGKARNRGIDEARGSFITFLDADDWYEEPTYLSALYEGATAHDVRVAGGCMVNWWGPGNEERSFAAEPFYSGYEFVADEVLDYADWQFDYGYTRFIYDRSLFEGGAHRFGSLRFFEDPVFFVGIMGEAGRFFGTPRAHYVYRLDRAARDWKTGEVLDLIEGAKQNLAYSREHGLAKLHRFTVKHFDFYAYGIGLGCNRALIGSAQVIGAKLTEFENLIDEGLLREAGETELPYVLRLRRAVDGEEGFDPQGSAYRRARYYYARR